VSKTSLRSGRIGANRLSDQERDEIFGEIIITRALCEFGEERWHLEQRGSLS